MSSEEKALLTLVGVFALLLISNPQQCHKKIQAPPPVVVAPPIPVAEVKRKAEKKVRHIILDQLGGRQEFVISASDAADIIAELDMSMDTIEVDTNNKPFIAEHFTDFREGALIEATKTEKLDSAFFEDTSELEPVFKTSDHLPPRVSELYVRLSRRYRGIARVFYSSGQAHIFIDEDIYKKASRESAQDKTVNVPSISRPPTRLAPLLEGQ